VAAEKFRRSVFMLLDIRQQAAFTATPRWNRLRSGLRSTARIGSKGTSIKIWKCYGKPPNLFRDYRNTDQARWTRDCEIIRSPFYELGFKSSDFSSFLAEVSWPANNRLSNDQVIKEVDLENSCTGCDSLGESQIRVGRTHGARGVVVHQCETERRMRDCRSENLAWTRKRCVHRPF
jgi:hypothetical protein